MKKWLLCLLLPMLLLTACKKPAANSDIPAQQEPPVLDVPAEPSLLDGKILVEGALFSIENAYCQNGVQQELHLFGEQLLVFGPQYGEENKAQKHLALLDFSAGQVLHSLPVDLSAQLQVCEDRIVLLKNQEGSATFLDPTLDTLGTTYVGYMDGTLAINTQGNILYCLRPQQGIFVKNMLEGGGKTILKNVANLYAGTRVENNLSVSYTDRYTQQQVSAILDLDAEKVLEIPFEGVFSAPQRAGDYWLCGLYGETGEYLLGTENRPYRLSLTEKYSAAFFLHNPDRILVKRQTDAGMELSLYELDGTFLSRITVAGSPTNLLWWQGGYLFLATDETGRDRLMFWDLGVPVSGAPLTLTPAYQPPASGGAVSQSLYTRASVLGQAYGVQIRIAEQIDARYEEFTAQPELGETLIAQGLDALEQVLSQFPESFMPQLRYGTRQSVEIHLAGSIGRKNQPEQVSGFAGFAGFTEPRAAKTVIVLDLTRPGTLWQTFCHELAHVIEGKLAFDASIRQGTLYSVEAWRALNPSGFRYAETYDEMPTEYFTDGYDAYFMDLYSRTYQKEDQARILEHAMAQNTWMFSTPERKAKLQYLCKCIRDSFHTEDWPEVTFWELAL